MRSRAAQSSHKSRPRSIASSGPARLPTLARAFRCCIYPPGHLQYQRRFTVPAPRDESRPSALNMSSIRRTNAASASPHRDEIPHAFSGSAVSQFPFTLIRTPSQSRNLSCSITSCAAVTRISFTRLLSVLRRCFHDARLSCWNSFALVALRMARTAMGVRADVFTPRHRRTQRPASASHRFKLHVRIHSCG